MNRNERTARGFTLIELAVVLAVSVIVVMLLGFTLRDLARTNAQRQLATDVQLEGRAGINLVEEDLREASLGSALGVVVANTAAGVQGRPAVQVFDNVPGGTWLDVKPGTDALLVVSAAFRQVNAARRMAPIQASVNAQNFDPVAVPLSVTDVAGFAPGQFVVVGPYKTAGWARVGVVQGVPDSPGLLQLGVTANVFPGGKADVGSLVRVATARLYYVNLQDELSVRELRVPHAPGAAADLDVGSRPIARGVENLQIDCQLDGGGLGWFQACGGPLGAGDIANESVASGLANPRLDVEAVSKLRTVSMTVVARSRNPLVDSVGDAPIAVGNQAALDPRNPPHPVTAPYARRVYRAEVAVRNTSLGVL